MANATWEELLERNKKYSESKHRAQPSLTDPGVQMPDKIIFSCIDFRVSVEELLGIKSEEAFIVRVAGGRIRSGFNSLLFLETFSKEQAIKDLIVIHHTDCGCTHATDEGVKNELKAKAPQLAHEIDPLYFGTFGSSDMLEESVREDLEFLNSQPLIKQELKDRAKGYVYDIKTGRLIPVSRRA